MLFPRTGRKLALIPLSLALTWALLSSACASPPEPPKNLLFISLDTTRSDHMSTYGYERETTPRIDELASTGAVFTTAIAQMGITNPSHASMMTGLYPHTHKVGENTRQLPEERVTLSEVLLEAGFRTGGFVGGLPLKPNITGIDQGFEVYDGRLKQRRDGGATTDLAVDWLEGLDPNDRFFLFVHYYDAHGPYMPKEPYLGFFESENAGRRLDFIPQYQRTRDKSRSLNYFVDRYDSLIRYQDDLVGRLLAAIDLEDTLVVIVADHGETIGERSIPLTLNHGTALYEEQIAIPMILHGPGVNPGRYPEPVETVDLMPTILPLLGIEMPPDLGVQGQSLVPILRGESLGRQPLAFSSNRTHPKNYLDRGYDLEPTAFMNSVRSHRWKLMQYPGIENDYYELYDLQEDPGELVDVAEAHPDVVNRLRGALETWGQLDELLEAQESDLSEEDIEALKSLGYL